MTNGVPYHQALQQYQLSATRPLRAEERPDDNALLRHYHPDYDRASQIALSIGVNRNSLCHRKLAELLQSDSLTTESMLNDAETVNTDLLVIGSGGAGCSAALAAAQHGANVIVATKLRSGDSNTVMAEGGIQASIEPDDTPQRHFDETFNAGHCNGDRKLIAQMVMDGPDVIRWLIEQGMQFDVDDNGDLATRRAGGTSRDRILYYRDYTGLEMMRVLREAVRNETKIALLDHTPAVELLSNGDGHCSGALLYSTEQKRYIAVEAKAVILATGGLGRLHLNGFPTSNHIGATGDGLVLAYRLGAKLQGLNSFQYHPTGFAWPHTLAGTLITEGVRSAGTQLINSNGERFIDELAPRDIVSAAIMRECREGRGIALNADRQGVWLDTPALELREPGLLVRRFPKFMELCHNNGLDPQHAPILICPTLHYQNGGVVIDRHGSTTVPGLYCAGEICGGIHGTNRIMGNALLEIISFGRRAGTAAAERCRESLGTQLTLTHLERFRRELSNTGVASDKTGPQLFPWYAGFSR